MYSCRVNNLAITIEKQASDPNTKANYPPRIGRYSEIRTPHYEFHFNLRGQIRFIRSLGMNWRHPAELLKRSDGNDWIFYSVGTVGARISSWLGQYYLPCPAYTTNAVYPYNPFTDQNVTRALGDWAQLYADIHQAERRGLPEPVANFFDLVSRNDETSMFRQAQRLNDIIGGRFSVLPPDTRLLDYEVIPLTVADGCRYHCGFCCVKSPLAFKARPLDDIQNQIKLLKDFYGPDIGNYQGLFLGNHDALGAGDELLVGTVSTAMEVLAMNRPTLFMFGSADSLLQAGDELFAYLDQAAGQTYINLGLESVHPATLAQIKKPLDPAKVRRAFQKMLHINQHYDNIQVTANFLLGDQLPREHTRSLMELLQEVPDSASRKGAVYLSPLLESQKKPELLDTFFEIQRQSKLPTWIYLIQRL